LRKTFSRAAAIELPPRLTTLFYSLTFTQKVLYYSTLRSGWRSATTGTKNSQGRARPDRQYAGEFNHNHATAFEATSVARPDPATFSTAATTGSRPENGVSLLVSMFYMYLRPFDGNQRREFFLFLRLQYLKRRLFLLYISKRCGKTFSTYTPK
jgi:hypothetical protein